MAVDAHDESGLIMIVRDAVRAFRAGLREATEWSLFAWLRPSLKVRVRQTDGSTFVLQGAKANRRASQHTRVRFSALLMPRDHVLTKRVDLPDLPMERIQQALALDAASESPFPAKDTVWGWRLESRSDDGIAATLALTSRQRVESLLEQVYAGKGQGALPEIWAEAEPPLPLLGYGEERRAMAERRLARLLITLLVLIASLAALALATPFLQLRAQVIDAQQQMTELHSRAAEALVHRDALTRLHAQAGEVQSVLKGQVNLLDALEMLAVVFPDTVYLDSFNMQGSRVRIAGQGPNASLLVDQLGAHERIRELRSTSAITGVGDGTEKFGVEFILVSPTVGGAGS